MTKDKKPDVPKPVRENNIPLRKSDRDSVPLSESPNRRIFDVTDTRPPPQNPHRNTKGDDEK